jgi:hypothetical protein
MTSLWYRIKRHRQALIWTLIAIPILVLLTKHRNVTELNPTKEASARDELKAIASNHTTRTGRRSLAFDVSEHERLSKLSVEELALLLKSAAFASYTSEEERRSALGNLAAALAKALGFHDTRALISSTLGEGAETWILMNVVTRFSADSVDDILAALDDTYAKDEILQIVTGLHIKSYQQNTDVADLPKLLGLISNDPMTLRALSIFELSLHSDPDSRRKRFSELIEVSTSMPEEDRLLYLKALFSASNNYLPAETWEAVQKFSGQSEFQSLRQDAFLRMMDDNAAGTLARLSGSTTATDATLMGKGFQKWLSQSPIVAMKWLEEHQQKFGSVERDGIAMALASHSASTSKDGASIKEAWAQVEKIQDPALRKSAEGQVWKKEKQMLQSSVAKDPAITLSSIISGTSGHEIYWIEEAMHTWIQKDPAQAEEWYKNNWDSIPAAKSQYIAAAYAKEALGAGDLATARQWTNLIQDPKTKERIAASIDTAQSTQGQ